MQFDCSYPGEELQIEDFKYRYYSQNSDTNEYWNDELYRLRTQEHLPMSPVLTLSRDYALVRLCFKIVVLWLNF